MKKQPAKRSYRSDTRQRQADETRRRIADAAEEILCGTGYAGMTVAAVAAKAKVAPQTVYAVYGSKRGILAELYRRLLDSTFTPEVKARAEAASTPEELLSLVAQNTRIMHEEHTAAFAHLRGVAVVSPDLAELERELEQIRYEELTRLVERLRDVGRIRPELTEDKVRDICWVLTSRDLYRMLVQLRGWKAEEYEAWIKEAYYGSLYASAG